MAYTVMGDTLFYARRYERSVESYRKCLELDPTFGAAHTDLARSLEQVGRADEAVEEFVRGTAGSDGLPQPSSGLAILYARAGRRDDARATLEAVLALAQKQFVSPYGIASYYSVIGGAMNARSTGWRRPTPSAMERWFGSRCTCGSMPCEVSRAFAACLRACGLIHERQLDSSTSNLWPPPQAIAVHSSFYQFQCAPCPSPPTTRIQWTRAQ